MSTKQSFHKIIALRVSNVKRIRTIEILPQGDVITIGGKNDQGKSSLLDSIFYLLAGNAVVCDQPIRQGASKAEIHAELKEYPGTDEKQILIGDLIVTKKFTTSGAPTLRITTKDGAPVTSPQTILDQLCVKVTFDPLEFTRQPPAKQVETLRKLVGLDFTDQDSKRKSIYDERTQTNRELASRKAKLNSLPVVTDAPAAEVSVSDLMGELNVIRKFNQENEKIRNQKASVNSVLHEAKRRWEEQGERITALKAQLEQAEAALLTLKGDHVKAHNESQAHAATVATLVDKDESEVNKRITSADKDNAKVREHKARLDIAKEITDLEGQEQRQTAQIDALDAEKEKALSEAKFPLEGLTFDDSGVLLNKVPFNQAGTAAKIKASMAIGLALNPRLRVVLIRDGLLIDDEGMAAVADMAKANDCQVWVERGATGEKTSVVLEDGNLKEV